MSLQSLAMGHKAKLGSGQRFAALKGKLAHEPGVTNPSGLAAFLGRKTHGAGKMAKWASAGRKSALPPKTSGPSS